MEGKIQTRKNDKKRENERRTERKREKENVKNRLLEPVCTWHCVFDGILNSEADDGQIFKYNMHNTIGTYHSCFNFLEWNESIIKLHDTFVFFHSSFVLFAV